MNKEDTLKAIEVMRAHATGAEIETARRDRAGWAPSVTPNWNWGAYDYRVKPEPRTFRVWIKDNSMYPYQESHAGQRWQEDGWKLTEVVEKLP